MFAQINLIILICLSLFVNTCKVVVGLSRQKDNEKGLQPEHIAQVLEAILFLFNNKSLADVGTAGEEKIFSILLDSVSEVRHLN